MNQEQRGGKLLGQGLYGCAFDPPLICKDKTSLKPGRKIGKITSQEDANQEYTISKSLQQLPFAEEYFILIDGVCQPKPRTNQVEKSIKNCKPLENQPLPKFSQLIMSFGGKPLLNLSSTLTKDSVMKLSQKILEAGTLLLLGNIVHGDLHGYNVLVDSQGNARCIDFGFAWNVKQLTLSNVHVLIHYFAPYILQETPECSVIDGIQNNISRNYIFAKIGDEKNMLSILYKLTGRTVDDQLHELDKFTKTSISFRNKDWLSFFKIYWTKIDAWAIGNLIMYMFLNIIDNNEQGQEIQQLFQVILGLCEMDPGKRLDAAEALELLAPESKVLELEETKQWLVKQKQLRNDLLQKIGVQ